MRHLLVLALLTAGCLRTTEYKCEVDGDCTATGSVCESTKFCSFIDTDCTSGRRYGELSGSYANQCVGDGVLDGGIDSPIDGSNGNCPATYAALPNAGTHVYKLTTNASQWSTQRDRCMTDGAYLAIPDNAAEVTAIATAGAAARTWVGISDVAIEGTFVTVKGGTPPYLMFDPGETNSANQDCVSALMGNTLLGTDTCGQTFPAVCECDP